MKKIVRLTERDLTKLLKKILSEDLDMMDVSSDSDYYKVRKREVSIPFDDLAMLGHFATRYCEGNKETLPDCKQVKNLYSQYQLYM
jgi:hypothetical protein